jgi:hypothetical protein
MEEINDHEAYDGIVIRQALNYLAAKALVPALMRWRVALEPGGKLLFNSFIQSSSVCRAKFKRGIKRGSF